MTLEKLHDAAWGRHKNQSGAFDLPSIMIGVAVVAILTVGVLVAIFGVIPWAQDRAAQQDLVAVHTAQGAAYSKDGGFTGRAGLVDADLLGQNMPAELEIRAAADGLKYVGVNYSTTGAGYIITSEEPAPRGLFNNDLWPDGSVIDETAPEPPEKVFSETISDITSLNQLSFLNNGGTLKATAAGVFITERHGAVPRKLEGLDTKLTGVLNTEASPSGKTVIVFNNQWAQVSWNGGLTWTAPRQASYFALGRPYQRAAISGDGDTVLISSSTLSQGNFLAIVHRSTGLWVEKAGNLSNYHALAADGATAVEAKVVSSGTVRKVDSTLSGSYSTVSTPAGANYTGFDVAGDLNTLAISMRAHNTSIYGTGQKLFISRDAGATWEAAIDGTFHDVNISQNGKRMVAISDAVIHLSKDGGFSWMTVDPIGGVGVSGLELSQDGKTMVIRDTNSQFHLVSVSR